MKLIHYAAPSALIAAVAAFVFFILLRSDSVALEVSTTLDKTFVAIGLLGMFGFWFMMLGHFFQNARVKRRVIWGFSLLVFSWVAALLYFVSYFLPEMKKSQ